MITRGDAQLTEAIRMMRDGRWNERPNRDIPLIISFFLNYDDSDNDEFCGCSYDEPQKKFIEFIETHSLAMTTGYVHSAWCELSESILDSWLYATILRNDFYEFRLAVQFYKYCDERMNHRIGNGSIMNFSEEVNAFTWFRNVGGQTRFHLNPLTFACITGRYSIVRVMLEEFPEIFKRCSLMVHMADALITLPLATMAFDLFLPCYKYKNVFIEMSACLGDGKMKEWVADNLESMFRTDHAKKLSILKLLAIHFPHLMADFKRRAVLFFPCLHHEPPRLTFDFARAVRETGLAQGEEALSVLSEVPSLLSLTTTRVAGLVNTYPQQKAFKKYCHNGLHLPACLIDLIINKDLLL